MFFPGMWRTPLILLQLTPGQEFTNVEINNLLAQVNSQYKVASQLSMTKAHEVLIAQDKLAASIAAALAIMALGLVAIGLYGIVSYSLQLRQFELGIRMAIGATPRQLLMRLLIDNLGPVIAGLLMTPMALVALMIWFKAPKYAFEISLIDWILPWLLILLVVVLITLSKTSKIVNQPASIVLREA